MLDYPLFFNEILQILPYFIIRDYFPTHPPAPLSSLKRGGIELLHL